MSCTKSLVFLTALAISAAGCGNSSPGSSTEDSSTSGSVASVLGGSYNSANGNGTQTFLYPQRSRSWELADLLNFVPDAIASMTCPTIASGTSGTNCSANGSGSVTLTYSQCKFPGATATWNGTQTIVFTGAASVACGAAFPSGETEVARTFGDGTTRTAASGTSVSIDTDGGSSGATCGYSGSDCQNDGGTGMFVTLSSGVRTGIGIHSVVLVATGHKGNAVFNHTINTNSADGGAPVVIGNGNTITSGTVVVYHNLAKVKGLTTFSDVTFSTGCCVPTGGTITTTFQGTSSTLSRFVSGAKETLQLTGCGTGSYTGPEGYSGSVTLAHCF